MLKPIDDVIRPIEFSLCDPTTLCIHWEYSDFSLFCVFISEANISDYFNYGFNEETWSAYCKKQAKLKTFKRKRAKIMVRQHISDVMSSS